MTWTDEIPTESGYYWLRVEDCEDEVVRVDAEVQRMHMFGHTGGMFLKVHPSRPKPLWQPVQQPTE